MDDDSEEVSYDEDEEEDDAIAEEEQIEETPVKHKSRPPQKRQSSWKRQAHSPEPSGIDGVSGGREDSTRDVIDKGFLTMKEATELFDRYVNVLLPNYPSIVFAPGTTAAEVREKRPILYAYLQQA